MRVPCTIDTTELENDYGRMIPGVTATCSRCGHETESFGESDASIRRCLILLKEECPKSEQNYYFEGEEE